MAAASVYASVMGRSTFVLSISLVLSQLCAVWAAAPPEAELCFYAASCENVSLSTESGRPVLSGECIDCDRVLHTTAAVDLNQRVQFKNGRLQCTATGGSFTRSCSNLALSGSTLSATCRASGGGSSIAARIDLNNCLGNINGNLVWCVGTPPCTGMYDPPMPAKTELCVYAATCRNVSLSTESGRPVLRASCIDCNRVVQTRAAVNLNQRVQFTNGRLQCAATGGGFTRSCSNLALSGSTLSATCRESGGGSSIAASIDLNNCLGNINGNLVWCVGDPPCKGKPSMYSPLVALAHTAFNA